MSDIVVGMQDSRGSQAEVFRRISWGAVFGGTLTALSMELIFLSFGLFIGFMLTGGGAVAWTEAWYLVGVFFSLLIGGWVAGRLSGNPTRSNGMQHGIVMWGLTMFTTIVAAVTLLWDVVRASLNLLSTAAVTAPGVPAAAANTNMTHVATMAANDVSTTALVIFGGLILALIGAMIGGGWAAPMQPDFLRSRREYPEGTPHHA